jgi:hypothetical protein
MDRNVDPFGMINVMPYDIVALRKSHDRIEPRRCKISHIAFFDPIDKMLLVHIQYYMSAKALFL